MWKPANSYDQVVLLNKFRWFQAITIVHVPNHLVPPFPFPGWLCPSCSFSVLWALCPPLCTLDPPPFLCTLDHLLLLCTLDLLLLLCTLGPRLPSVYFGPPVPSLYFGPSTPSLYLDHLLPSLYFRLSLFSLYFEPPAPSLYFGPSAPFSVFWTICSLLCILDHLLWTLDPLLPSLYFSVLWTFCSLLCTLDPLQPCRGFSCGSFWFTPCRSSWPGRHLFHYQMQKSTFFLLFFLVHPSRILVQADVMSFVYWSACKKGQHYMCADVSQKQWILVLFFPSWIFFFFWSKINKWCDRHVCALWSCSSVLLPQDFACLL